MSTRSRCVSDFYKSRNGDADDSSEQLNNLCPDTVAVEYEVIGDNLTTSELSDITELSDSDSSKVSSDESTRVILGIPYISTHFNNKLSKNQPECLDSDLRNISYVSDDKGIVNQKSHTVHQNLINCDNAKDRQIKRLKKQCCNLSARLKKYKQRITCYKGEIKNSKHLTREKFDSLTKRVPEVGRRLMWMQLHQPKKKNGYRFDTKEKLLCLAIRKYKPECYKFLKKSFVMPGNKTLKNFIAKLQKTDLNLLDELCTRFNEPISDESEHEEAVTDSLLETAEATARIVYEEHNVLSEFMHFNNNSNLADFTDFEHGLY